MLIALTLAAGACSGGDGEGGAPSTDDELPASPTIQVELAGRPSAVAVGDVGVWVTDDGSGTEPGRVWLLADGVAPTDQTDGADHARGAPLAEVGVGPAPVAVVAVADGAWAIGATGTITRVAVAERAPGQVTLSAAEPVVVGGALVDAVVRDDRLYVGDIEAGVIHVLDAATGAAVAAPISVPAGVVRLAVAGERLWVTGLEREVTPVDLASGAAGTPVGVGTGPIGLAVVGDVVWVANSDDDTVSRLDARTGAPVGAPAAVGDAPIALVDDGRGGVWVLNQDDRSLLRLHAGTGEPVGEPVPLVGRPRGLAAARGGGAWVVGVDPPRAAHHPG